MINDQPPKPSKPERKPPTLTVGGVTLTADQIKTAVVIIEGREIYIGEKEAAPKAFGFTVKEGENP